MRPWSPLLGLGLGLTDENTHGSLFQTITSFWWLMAVASEECSGFSLYFLVLPCARRELIICLNQARIACRMTTCTSFPSYVCNRLYQARLVRSFSKVRGHHVTDTSQNAVYDAYPPTENTIRLPPILQSVNNKTSSSSSSDYGIHGKNNNNNDTLGQQRQRYHSSQERQR